jgi:hypothetical protein
MFIISKFFMKAVNGKEQKNKKAKKGRYDSEALFV